MKPKICIVADVPNWAFDSIAQKIKKELSYKYDIRITYFNRRTESDYLYEFIERNKDCDLFHFLNRRILLLMKTEIFKQKIEKSGAILSEYISNLRNKFTTGIYDYMDIDENGINEHSSIFNEYTKEYYTATKKLFKIYKSIKKYKKPTVVIPDICDEKTYIPLNIERFDYENIKDRELIIGWVGNSLHTNELEVDLKGFRTILKPVVKELINEGYNFKENYADRNVIWKSIEEMPNYYAEIDICVCVSVHEGTPRPVLESMHCGVPIISTNVGIVPEVFGNKQKKFNIGDRNNGLNDEEIRTKLKEKLVYIYNNRQILKKLSLENLRSVKKFDGGKTIKKFEKFFDMCLKDN